MCVCVCVPIKMCAAFVVHEDEGKVSSGDDGFRVLPSQSKEDVFGARARHLGVGLISLWSRILHSPLIQRFEHITIRACSPTLALSRPKQILHAHASSIRTATAAVAAVSRGRCASTIPRGKDLWGVETAGISVTGGGRRSAPLGRTRGSSSIVRVSRLW